MIAFKHIDYTLYFDDIDLTQLIEGREIVFNQLQNYTEREPSKFSLKTKDEIKILCKEKPGMLVFQNEAELAVVHLSEREPTEHIFYFDKDWFNQTMQAVKKGNGSASIRWNDSGDKIFFLAGNGSEAKKFMMMYGPG
jgi:hypothetical protein